MSNLDATATKPPSWHWVVFSVLVIVGVAITGIGWGGYSYGLGYMALPAVVCYFVIRRATTVKGLIPGYLLFIAMASILIWQDISRHLKSSTEEMYKICLERVETLGLTPVGQRNPYCKCISENFTPTVVWKAAVAFATHSDPEDAKDDLLAKMTKVSADCSAALGAN